MLRVGQLGSHGAIIVTNYGDWQTTPGTTKKMCVEKNITKFIRVLPKSMLVTQFRGYCTQPLRNLRRQVLGREISHHGCPSAPPLFRRLLQWRSPVPLHHTTPASRHTAPRGC